MRPLRSLLSALSALSVLSVLSVLALSALVTACDDSGSNGAPDAGPDGNEPPPCFAGTPTTHDELINACTAASVEKLDKTTNLPLVGADGTLPPIP